MSGECVYTVRLIEGEREIEFSLVTYPEDLNAMVDVYRQIYGMVDAPSVIVHEEESEWNRIIKRLSSH